MPVDGCGMAVCCSLMKGGHPVKSDSGLMQLRSSSASFLSLRLPPVAVSCVLRSPLSGRPRM
jgi:hypothetical protein